LNKIHKAAVFRVAVDGNVPEILREAGPQVILDPVLPILLASIIDAIPLIQGLHIQDISQRNGLDHKKLCEYIGFMDFHYRSVS
jgi:hypothetical protein